MRDEKIAIRIVVEVPHTHALCPPAAIEPGLGGDVGEAELTEIAIETARRIRASSRIQRGGAGHEHVHEAVVVEIEDRDARAGGFENVLLLIFTARDDRHGQAGLLGEVAELHGDGGRSVSMTLAGRGVLLVRPMPWKASTTPRPTSAASTNATRQPSRESRNFLRLFAAFANPGGSLSLDKKS